MLLKLGIWRKSCTTTAPSASRTGLYKGYLSDRYLRGDPRIIFGRSQTSSLTNWHMVGGAIHRVVSNLSAGGPEQVKNPRK